MREVGDPGLLATLYGIRSALHLEEGNDEVARVAITEAQRLAPGIVTASNPEFAEIFARLKDCRDA